MIHCDEATEWMTLLWDASSQSLVLVRLANLVARFRLSDGGWSDLPLGCCLCVCACVRERERERECTMHTQSMSHGAWYERNNLHRLPYCDEKVERWGSVITDAQHAGSSTNY